MATSGSAARLRQIELKIENSERHEARQHLLLSPLTPKQSTFTAPKLLIWCILVLAVDLELKHAHQFELLELLVDVVQHGGEQDPSRQFREQTEELKALKATSASQKETIARQGSDRKSQGSSADARKSRTCGS